MGTPSPSVSHRETALVSIFCTVFLIGAVYYWSWLTDQSHGGVVNAVSLIISAVGFPIALLQLWRTKKAAVAAEHAANEAKVRFTSFNALRECDRAKVECQALAKVLDAECWEEAVTRSNALADHIIEIQHSNVNIGKEFSDELGRGAFLMEAISRVIEKELKADKGRLERTKQLQELRKVYVSLNKAGVLLERQSS